LISAKAIAFGLPPALPRFAPPQPRTSSAVRSTALMFLRWPREMKASDASLLVPVVAQSPRSPPRL